MDNDITNLKIFVRLYHYYIVDKSFLGKNNPFMFSTVTNNNLKMIVSHDRQDCFFPKSAACFKSVCSLAHKIDIIHRNYD